MTGNAIVGSVLLAALAAVNVRIAGSLRYPPALFSGWWSLLLLALACSGDTLFPISASTLAVYLIGPCAMSLGGLVALAVESRRSVTGASREPWTCRQGALTASTVVLLAFFPALCLRIREVSALSGIRDFWVGVRFQTMTPDRPNSSLGMFDYLTFFSTVAALVAFEDYRRRKTGRIRAFLTIGIALAYHLVTASRLGALILIGGLVGIALLHGKRVVWPVLAGSLAVIPIFVTVAVALNKGIERGGDLAANAISLTRSFRLYALGGVVAFENAVDGTLLQTAEGRTYRPVFVLARAAGYDVEAPSLVSHYSYTPTPTNVYTIYYPYFVDFGYAGVAVILAILGWFSGWVYLSAKVAAGAFTVAYGLMFSYIVLSSADEYLFSLFSMNCQALLYLLCLYKRPDREPQPC